MARSLLNATPLKEAFVRTLAAYTSQFSNEKTMFSNREAPASNIGCPTVIGVLFDFKWPTNSDGSPASLSDVYENKEVAAIASIIYDLKIHLEDELNCALSSFEIETGCVFVQFEVPGELEIDEIRSAIDYIDSFKEDLYVDVIEARVRDLTINSNEQNKSRKIKFIAPS